MRIFRRLALALAATAVAALIAAIAIAILDLYLAGHGYAAIRKEAVSWPAAGIHLSAADIVLLLLALAAGGITWRAAGGSPK